MAEGLNAQSRRLESQDSLRDRRLLSRVVWCLRITILIQCLGVGGRYLITSYETESPVYGWLYFENQWPEANAQTVDNLGALATVCAGTLLILGGTLCRKRSGDLEWIRLVHHIEQVAAIWIAFWMLALACAQMMRASMYPEWSLAEHSVRYAAPLALLVLGRIGSGLPSETKSVMRRKTVVGILIVATAATFIAHGFKAIQRYSPFTDLILLSNLQWSNLAFGQATAETLLVGIGVVDILVAIALITMRLRWVAFYMAAWGLLTAFSRVAAFGIDAWPETLLRIQNGGVPLVILLFWNASNAPLRRSPKGGFPSKHSPIQGTQ